MSADYYELLGIKRDATPIQIKKAFREKAKVLHPDKCRAENAHQKFIEVKKAYDVLSNPEERRRYDLTRPAPRQSYSHQNQKQQQQSSGTTYTCYNHNGTFMWGKTNFNPRSKPKYKKSQEWINREANGVFDEYMGRMRRQREEEMKRRYAAFSAEDHAQNCREDVEASRRMSRLKLFWAKNVIYELSDLKDRLNAKFMFPVKSLNSAGATAAFQTAQEALTASQILDQEFRNITYNWLTPKPAFDHKDTINIDSDSDVEIMEDDDDDDVEFVSSSHRTFVGSATGRVFEQQQNPDWAEQDGPEVIGISDSDDEEELIEEEEEEVEYFDEHLEANNPDDVQMISDSDLTDSELEEEEPEEVVQNGPPQNEEDPIEISDSESDADDVQYQVTNSLNSPSPIVVE